MKTILAAAMLFAGTAFVSPTSSFEAAEARLNGSRAQAQIGRERSLA